MAKRFVATASFAPVIDGVQYNISAGVEYDHSPVVEKFSVLFVEVPERQEKQERVVTATADPGRKRGADA